MAQKSKAKLHRPVWSWLVGLCVIGIPATQVASSQTPSAETACAALRTLHREGLTIRDARYVPAGPFVPSDQGNGPRRATLSLSAHCDVIAIDEPVVDSRIEIDLWLPDPSAWNGKLLGTGNGGYSSARSFGDMAQGLNGGYVVGASDTGHDGDDMRFGIGHPEKIRDWAYRATHELAVVEKFVTAALYGKPASKAYFQGCSTGGQQALSEAQRYPLDFDGIVAGDPGNDRILLNADFFASWLVMHPADGPAFPREKLTLLGRASVKACDKNDGVEDGVVNDPRSCNFDPASIQCTVGEATSSCLTQAEVSMVRTLYAGALHDGSGRPLYFGWTRSSEAGWGPYLVAPSQPTRLDFWTGWVYGDPNFNIRSFQPVSAIAAARKAIPYTEAVSHNLKPFRDHGGKLLLYHGWSDPVVPPENTIAYLKGLQSESETNSYARLFMVPGMNHCSGGPGATVFNPLAVLDAWVSSGNAPEVITATHKNGDTITFSRPLCAYPKVARWDGHGDTTQSSSYACVNDHLDTAGMSQR